MKARGALALIWLLYLAVFLKAQTVTFTDASAARTGWIGPGVVLTHDFYDSEVTSNLLVQDPGLEPFAYSSLIHVNATNAGNATYFDTQNQYTSYVPNELNAGTYNNIRAGVSVCSGLIVGNSGSSTTALTATVASGAVTGLTINSAAFAGTPNGTYSVLFAGGGGSGAAGTFTITGSTLTTGYTGGSITSTAITAGGSAYTSAPTVTILNQIAVASCGASGGFQETTGDYVIVRKIFSPTVQAAWPYLGWQTSGTVNAETTDLPSGDTPSGTADTQAMVIDGTSGTSSAQTYFDTGNGFGGQNHVKLTGPLLGKVSAKVSSGTGTLNYVVTRQATGGFSCSGSLSLTTTWTVFSYASTCNPAENGTEGFGTVEVQFSINGAVAYIDNPSLVDTANASSGNAFRRTVASDLEQYNGGVRVLDNQLTMPVAQILQPDMRGEMPYGFSEGCNSNPLWQCTNLTPITLPMALALRNAIGNGKPLWYVVPATLNMVDTTEAATLTEYMGGACGTTGGAIRCAQGTTTPYTTELAAESAQVDFELGNENWNNAGEGEKWLEVASMGVNGYTPYGYMAQSVCSSAKADASYSSTLNFVIGAQTSGGSSLYVMDALAKTSTGIALSCDSISQGPYWGYTDTSTGYNTATPLTSQAQSGFAEAYYDSNVSTASLYKMGNSGYPFQFQTYEFNGSGVVSPATGVPSMDQLKGYQNGWSAGLTNAITSLEQCAELNFCGFQGLFSYLNFDQTGSNGSYNTFTATTATGSNQITGVTPLTNLAVGIHLPSIAGVISNSSILSISGSTLTLSQSATASGSQSFTTGNPNLVAYTWGGWTGSGAQFNNYQRPNSLTLGALNSLIPAGSSLITSAWSSRGTWAYTALNGIPAISAVPKSYAYGFYKPGSPNRQYVIICADPTGSTCPVTMAGVALSGSVTQTLITSANATDVNETSQAVSTVASSVTMPSTYTAPAFSMTIFSGSTSASPSNTIKGGNGFFGHSVLY